MRDDRLKRVKGTTFLDEWDTLADRMHATPFMRYDWIAAWWKNFGRGEMRVLTARSGRRLTGLLPMLEQGGTLRSPVNAHMPIFGFLAEDESTAAELATTVLPSWKREWTRTTRHRIEIRAFAPTIRGVARWSAAHYGEPAARRLRRTAGNILRR
jgi:CelD/BcsL family acetyltransferase involved in cellulose biosynthesis